LLLLLSTLLGSALFIFHSGTCRNLSTAYVPELRPQMVFIYPPWGINELGKKSRLTRRCCLWNIPKVFFTAFD